MGDFDAGETLKRRLAVDVACPSCGYNLRGGVSVTCPECGVVIPLPLEDDESASDSFGRTTAFVLHLAAIWGLLIASWLVASLVFKISGPGLAGKSLVGVALALGPLLVRLWWGIVDDQRRRRRAWVALVLSLATLSAAMLTV